jgi:hypothetical protein
VDYYLPKVVASPPDALLGKLLRSKPTKVDARNWLERELNRVWPKAEFLVQKMRLNERYKDVTFETLNEAEFLPSVTQAFPDVDWDKTYAEFKAAGEAHGSYQSEQEND